MEITHWIESRTRPGTLADVARRVLESDKKYRDVEKTLQGMFVLEAVIKCGGNQILASQAIGVSRNTVNRALREMNLSASDVRRLIKHMRRPQ